MAALAALTPALQTIGTIATVAGTAVSAMGTLAAGKSAEQAAEFQAQQLDVRAKEEQAAAQREAEQLRRKKELALSTLTTRAAASGFTATDPTALNLTEDIAKYGTLQEQMAMYGGVSRRAGLEAEARAARTTGKAQRQGSYYKAAATILGGVSSLADRYNPRRSRPDALPTGLYYGTGGRLAAGYG